MPSLMSVRQMGDDPAELREGIGQFSTATSVCYALAVSNYDLRRAG